MTISSNPVHRHTRLAPMSVSTTSGSSRTTLIRDTLRHLIHHRPVFSMSGSAARLVGGSDAEELLEPGLRDLLSSEVYDSARENPGIHPLLPEVGFWRYNNDAEAAIAEPAPGLDIDGDASPSHPLASLDSSRPSSRASSQTLDGNEHRSESPVEFEVRRSKDVCVELPRTTLVQPKSQYDGFIPPLPPSRERDAVASLMDVIQAGGVSGQKEFFQFELDGFCFYIDGVYYPLEMRPLQQMATRSGHEKFYMDGVLSAGGVRHYVQKIPVAELPIGNYGPSNTTVCGQIWVRSKHNMRRELYYRLGKPRDDYARFYEPFLWVADLTKHVVDFSDEAVEKNRQVGLDCFKADFLRWLLKKHGGSQQFQRWRRKHPSDDYRTSVAANIDFIWKEMNGVLGDRKAHSLRLFREIIYFTQHKPTVLHPLPPVVQGGEKEPPTIVTLYIQHCFGHMIMGKMLKPVGVSHLAELPQPPAGLAGINRTPAAPIPIPTSRRSRTSEPCFLPLEAIEMIQIGDTISTPRDGDMTDTKWRSMVSKDATKDDRWFGLVQKVHIAKDGTRSFDVTWFYRPVETPCCMMKYPWPRELFLSDHCTCEEGAQARVKEYEVLGVHNVDWFGSPGEGNGEFFVRQTYMVDDRRWVTLRRSHITCFHDRQALGFRTGDTVLAALSELEAFSEPYEVVKIFKQGDIVFVRLRGLLRRSQIDPRSIAAPNELVYTEQLVVAKATKVTSSCLVRFYRPGDPIPTPYDRGGTGNCFYITHKLEASTNGDPPRCMPFQGDFPASLRQGFDPTAQSLRKLRGMDLFCGSGNFGRGLEEGGAVDMEWANDIWAPAIHTYMANSSEPDSTKPFLGSVDDLLRLALEGKFSENVPRPGDVEFISAGSPCPGFSLLTADKSKLVQVKNRSLVASFASFVDFYRPKYGILENVITIVQARHNRSEDVLSQLFCAIVGMGYQAQLILGDAWSHGAPQSRSRVFLYFAAPGLRLPEAPALSHSHFPEATARGLGEMCNGEPFVRRSFARTPFKYVNAADGCAGLPPIDDGKAEPAVAFPDHRTCAGVTALLRHQIAVIPTHPHGMNFVKAWRAGVISPADRELFPKEGKFRVSAISKAWGRVKPTDLFQTITTRSQPTDGRAGTGLHWHEDRPLTVHEIRRAQGFPDDEVLLGHRVDQWKLVGNSVARQMALALGLKFREAWAGSQGESGSGGGSREMSASVETSLSASVSRAVSRAGTASAADDMPLPRRLATAKLNRDRRQSTPRETGRPDRALAATTASPRWQQTVPPREFIDLTSELDEKSAQGQATSHEIVDLTAESQTHSLSRADGASGDMTGLSTVRPHSGNTGGTRKRLLEPDTETKELRSPKTVRLDKSAPDSTRGHIGNPSRISALGDSASGVNGFSIAGPEAQAPPTPARAPYDGLAPVRAGPTVVRLMTPNEEGRAGLDLG